MTTRTEEYKEGYNIGITWCKPWTPGGPYVYRFNGYAFSTDECARREKMAQESAQEAKDWRDGFNDGLIQRDILNKGTK